MQLVVLYFTNINYINFINFFLQFVLKKKLFKFGFIYLFYYLNDL